MPGPGEAETRTISLSPPAEAALRNSGRVIAMVHELHKAGYQRIRICPGLAPSGVHWRCTITYAANVGADGYSIRSIEEGHVARYTSGQGTRYFDWPEADGMSARRLADRFLTAFPLIAESGAGRDWAYAGWLTEVLGRCEHGKFPIFYADYPLDPEELRRWQPPPLPADVLPSA